MSEIRATSANIGLNMSSLHSQKKEGELTFALNAQIEGLSDEAVTYQNEQRNVFAAQFPDGYKVIGNRNILERDYIVYMLANPDGGSEIGKVDVHTHEYTPIINADCLGFDINFPIHKIIYKITNCSTELYWTDKNKDRRWLDLDNLPYKEIDGPDCKNIITDEIDCNKLSVQPNFSIPTINFISEGTEGELLAGTYQFGVQYSNSLGNGYTSFQGITNPFSINDKTKITPDFNYATGKSITFKVDNIDTTGIYDYINIVVIKTINGIQDPELIETRKITGPSVTVTYTGANKSPINFTMEEIFEKFPIYEKADDVFVVQDILGWSGLTAPQRKNYQKIANKIKLQWETHKLNGNKKENYSEGLNTATLRGYMRDEVYAPNVVFTIGKGRETDAFHIPGPIATAFDLEFVSNADAAGQSEDCDTPSTSLPRWKVYNTATKTGFSPEYIGHEEDDCYKGPYEYGEFGYVESTDTYPCDVEVWGELASKPIRHHRMPDSSVTHIHDDNGNIFPLGIRVDIDQIKRVIQESDLTEEEKRQITGFKIVRGNRATNKSIVAKGLLFNVGQYSKENTTRFFPNYPFNDRRTDPFLSRVLTNDDSGDNLDLRLNAFATDESKKRFTFHSPDTHFYQPALGNQLRIETVEYGTARSHFVEVKEHSRYKFLSTGSYAVSLGIAIAVGVASMSLVAGNIFDGTAAFTSFVALTNIIEKTIPRINYAYQQNSVGEYNSFMPVKNDGTKVRNIDLIQYVLSGINNVGDTHPLNNFQRESSVYIKTTSTLPFPDEYGAPMDESRWTLGAENACGQPFDMKIRNISSLYASIKRRIANQYGTIDSYEIIDTGFFHKLDAYNFSKEGTRTVFGGDVFINKFALKRKMPFFLDNRVGANFPDEADIFYNELANVAYPTYWMSTDYKNDDTDADTDDKAKGIAKQIKRIFGVKINNFDCDFNNTLFYQKGKFYLASIGIPVFYCESEINVDFRQAYDSKEGDFYPHVGEGIPDEWLQPSVVPYQQDNSYTYNKTYSKQNKESFFSTLPLEYKEICETKYDNKVIYSDIQSDLFNYKINNWLVYRPVSEFPLPLNYGKLISVEGIENRAILARFENKSMLYNAMITIDTSNKQAAYLGNDKLFRSSPAIDFAETELGYNGTQNKMFIKTEKGHISVDAKRGKVFIIGGNNAIDITDRKSNMEEFFKENLPFRISKYFPAVDTDNHFNNIGLHGVYDNKYNRFILTKLDYAPLDSAIVYKDGKFWKGITEVELDDPTMFCNKSFSISFDFDNARWISFHSYIPNFYAGGTNKFYSGRNEFESVWVHNDDATGYNSFYGVTFPFILEYPFSFKMNEEVLQSVMDNTKVLKYINNISNVVVNDVYFNKAIIYNSQQCTGLLELTNKPKNNPRLYISYPIYKDSSREILFTKSGNFYKYNAFWSVVKDNNAPIFLPPCGILDKELNEENMNYARSSYDKAPIRGRDTNIRHIYDATDQYKFLCEFLLIKTQPSYK